MLDLLFDPSKGLGLTIVRYNIGGGADLSFDTNLRPFGDIPGIKPRGPNAAYDWSADKQQRDVLFGARDRGANVFEAFSNSPPSWMSISGSVTGAGNMDLLFVSMSFVCSEMSSRTRAWQPFKQAQFVVSCGNYHTDKEKLFLFTRCK